MVGGDGVDGAVGQPGLDGVDVGAGPQRRVHLEHRVVALQQLVGQREVVRRRLGGDRQALGLGAADEVHAARGAEVQEVHRHTGEADQLDVAEQHQLLGQGRPAGQAEAAAARALVHHRALRERADLAVLGEHDAERLRVLQRAAHQLRVLHAVAVVGEQVHARGAQLAVRRELLAVASDGDAARRQHLAEPGLAALLAHELDDRHAVLRRVGVRHRHDGGETAECRGPSCRSRWSRPPPCPARGGARAGRRSLG